MGTKGDEARRREALEANPDLAEDAAAEALAAEPGAPVPQGVNPDVEADEAARKLAWTGKESGRREALAANPDVEADEAARVMGPAAPEFEPDEP